MTASILIVTGEASGDKHGANLVNELTKMRADFTITAMGGEALQASSADVIVDNRGLAVIVVLYQPQVLGVA